MQLHNFIIAATVITDHAAKDNGTIARIPTTPPYYPFKFKVIHFPVRCSFAMSINKPQGESLEIVGLDLENPYSPWRQACVYCFFKTGDKTLFILAENGKTSHFVYKE
jgi:ATP-dependent DNA helicase PIF1